MANNAQDLQLREAKDTIKELRGVIETLRKTNEVMQKENAELRETMTQLKEQIDYLTKRLFGTSSERREDDPEQLRLFNEAEANQDKGLLVEEEAEKTEEKPRKRRITNEERFKGHKVKKEYLDVAEEDRFCKECGTPLEEIGEEFIRREIDIVPAKITIIEYYSKTYSCPKCKDEAERPVIVKGSEGMGHSLYGMVTPRTVAWVMYQKYANGLPLYRQEKDWKQYGLDVSRATLSNWVIKNSEFFTPVYNYLHRLLKQRQFAMADETPVQVLHEKDRRAETKSYMWVFLSGEDGEKPIRLYKYSPTRAGETAVEFLDGFKGYIMCDGYGGYNKLKDAKRTACWAHIRRYLIDAVPKGKQYDYKLPAVQGVMYVNKLFSLEDKIQEKYKGDYEAIKQARDEQEKPVVEAFLAWADEQTAVKGSRFYQALVYIRNRKDTIARYLEDGHCSFSNNASERAVKDFVIGRKNWLFSDTPAGADASAVIYSIAATAKANGINIYQYLRYLLEKHLSENATGEELEQVLPWNPEVQAALKKYEENEGDPTTQK